MYTRSNPDNGHGLVTRGKDTVKNDYYDRGIFTRIVKEKEADDGLGDTGTSVVIIELESVDEIVDNFGKVFLDGSGLNHYDSYREGKVYDERYRLFTRHEPLEYFANECVKLFMPIYNHMRLFNVIAERIEILKEMLQAADEVDY